MHGLGVRRIVAPLLPPAMASTEDLMIAADVMTRDVVTVRPDTPVAELVQRLEISASPADLSASGA